MFTVKLYFLEVATFLNTITSVAGKPNHRSFIFQKLLMFFIPSLQLPGNPTTFSQAAIGNT